MCLSDIEMEDLINRIKACTTGVPPEVNLPDVMASLCGWKPLEAYEEMIVHYGNKVYLVRRTK